MTRRYSAGESAAAFVAATDRVARVRGKWRAIPCRDPRAPGDGWPAVSRTTPPRRRGARADRGGVRRRSLLIVDDAPVRWMRASRIQRNAMGGRGATAPAVRQTRWIDTRALRRSGTAWFVVHGVSAPRSTATPRWSTPPSPCATRASTCASSAPRQSCAGGAAGEDRLTRAHGAHRGARGRRTG